MGIEKTPESIEKRDIALCMDIVCSECGRLMALSNAYQHKNKYLCPRCARDLSIAIDRLIKDQP